MILPVFPASYSGPGVRRKRELYALKRVLILEDQISTLEWLKSIVETCADAEILTADNAASAYKLALDLTIDLFLVDIILEPDIMRDSSGLKFVDDMRGIDKYAFTPVIFITSLEDSRLYTYEALHCYGYIEKPFDENKVRTLVKKSLDFPGCDRSRKMLYFRKDGIILAADRDAIVYAEMVHQQLYLHTTEERFMHVPYMTLKQIMEQLDSPDIIQCSRNTIVNVSYVVNVDIPNRMIQLKSGFGQVEIGLSYKKHIKEYFKTCN